MGYRHSLYLIKYHHVLRKLSKKDFLPPKGDIYVSDILEKIGALEVAELGKYSDEGYYLEERDNSDIINNHPCKNLLLLLQECSHPDCGFNIVTKSDFIKVIESYKTRVKKNLLSRLKSYDAEPLESYTERIQSGIREKLHFIDDMVSLDISYENLYKVQTTWFYEYEIFDLVHLFKLIEWGKDILILRGA